MKCYLFTEAEYQSLLKELELEKFHTPDQFCLTPEMKEVQLKAVDSMHQRFHVLVARAFNK